MYISNMHIIFTYVHIPWIWSFTLNLTFGDYKYCIVHWHLKNTYIYFNATVDINLFSLSRCSFYFRLHRFQTIHNLIKVQKKTWKFEDKIKSFINLFNDPLIPIPNTNVHNTLNASTSASNNNIIIYTSKMIAFVYI